jgi:hypothetical protein
MQNLIMQNCYFVGLLSLIRVTDSVEVKDHTSRAKAGYNISTFTLRGVAGDGKGIWGYNWATPSLGDINTETCPPGWGVRRKADDLAP